MNPAAIPSDTAARTAALFFTLWLRVGWPLRQGPVIVFTNVSLLFMRRVLDPLEELHGEAMRSPSNHYTSWFGVLAATFSLLWFAHCVGPESPQEEQEAKGTLGIKIGPIGYDDLTNARYTLTLKNQNGEIVWVHDNLESDRFGDGIGDVTYVGTCDLSAPAGTFELVLNDLYTGNPPTLLDPDEYENPCPASNPCVKEAFCTENETQLTEFRLVIVLRADKGFLDMHVRLSDIFCSATLSCKPELLFVNGRRHKTHIVGLACTAGFGEDTRLYLKDFELDCPGSGPVMLDPGEPKGNQEPFSPVGAWAIYRDNEEFQGYRKGFWNLAFALEEGVPAGCHLKTTMTAAEGPLLERTTPADTRYPVIEVDLVLDAQDAACHPTYLLDGGNPHLKTRYTDFSETVCFEHEADIRTAGLRVYGGICPSP